MRDTAGYDLIGDIHGHADALLRLLKLLGYESKSDGHQHSERKVIFLGDFIDRGPKICEVIEIARTMVQRGNALSVMGNHEFNALAFHSTLPGRDDLSLRPRNRKNIRQHLETIRQLDDSKLLDALDWFREFTLMARARCVCRLTIADPAGGFSFIGMGMGECLSEMGELTSGDDAGNG